MSTMTLSAPIAVRQATQPGGARRVAPCGPAVTPSSREPRPVRTPARVAATERLVPALRLTRRGRLVLFLLALSVCVVASLAIATSGSASGTVQRLPVEYVTVVPGDTLWNIANDVAPSADPRDTVAQIIELNALDSSVVQAGQRLAVPVRN